MAQGSTGGWAPYETTGPGGSGRFTDYTNAGGTVGPRIPEYATIRIQCRRTGFAVADGNTWWYKIYGEVYYASADNFYNNGSTSGSLSGTPFYDPDIPLC